VDNVNEFIPENESDLVEILRERYPVTAVENQHVRSFIDKLRARLPDIYVF